MPIVTPALWQRSRSASDLCPRSSGPIRKTSSMARRSRACSSTRSPAWLARSPTRHPREPSSTWATDRPCRSSSTRTTQRISPTPLPRSLSTLVRPRRRACPLQFTPSPGVRRRKIGGVIAQLHTSLAKLNARYYSALVNWGDGIVQPGKLARSGAHGFKLNATHIYRVRGSYVASVTVSDRVGDSLTKSFTVLVH